MRDPAQHREPGVGAEPETLAHPGEEVGEAVVPALDALRDARAPARERERADAVRAEHDIGVRVGEASRRLEDVGFAVGVGSACNGPVGQDLQCGDLDANLELGREELAHGRADLPRAFEHDEAARLGDLQVDRLPRWRVRGVYS